MAKKEIIKNGLVTVRVNEAPVVDAAHSVVSAVESVPGHVEHGAVAAVEGVEHGAEVAVDAVESAAKSVFTLSRNNPYVVGGVVVVAAAAGGVVGYYYAKRKIVAHYDLRMEKEMAATQDHIERATKTGRYASPSAAAGELISDADEAVRSYSGEQMAPFGLPKKTHVLHDAVDDEGEPVVEYVLNSEGDPVVSARRGRSVVVEGVTAVAFDYDQELSMRASNPDSPYVVSMDEYNENEGGFEQDTLMYYVEDDTLVDTRDQIVDNTEYTVGDDNLLRFGHGSNDPNVVYIRNEKTGMDFEVIRDQRSYQEAVLGIKPAVLRHSDVRRHGRFRDADE